jgi:hypothetical protein
LCGTEQETELFPKIATETGGWFSLTVRNAKDLREKIECAVCATCAERIADLKREREAEDATGIVPGPSVATGSNQEPMTPQQAEAQRLRNMRLELDWLPRSKADDPKNWTPKREARLQELIGMKERGEI